MAEWRVPFCPMCGLSVGQKNITVKGKPWIKLDQENLWEKAQSFTGDKPFGVIKSSEGRGTMKMERYYGIEEDVEGYFPLMKARLINVLKEWLAKGWITQEELEEILK